MAGEKHSHFCHCGALELPYSLFLLQHDYFGHFVRLDMGPESLGPARDFDHELDIRSDFFGKYYEGRRGDAFDLGEHGKFLFVLHIRLEAMTKSGSEAKNISQAIGVVLKREAKCSIFDSAL